MLGVTNAVELALSTEASLQIARRSEPDTTAPRIEVSSLALSLL